MDLTRILEQLYAERDRVGQTIATLEQFQQENNTPVPAPSTRGRKSMGAEERKVVAERMKTYWAKKRQQDSKQSSEDSECADPKRNDQDRRQSASVGRVP